MIKRRYSSALLVVALAVAVFLVYSAREELVAAVAAASVLFLGLVYLTTLAQNLTLWLVFHASAGAGGEYLQTAKMHFGGQVAKYVPGKVWSFVYQATLKADEMPMGNIVQGNIVIYTLGVMSVVFSSLALITYPYSMPAAVIILLMGAAVSSYFMSSDHLYRVIQRFSVLTRRFTLTENVPATDFPMPLRVGVYLILLATYVLSNLFLLYAFFDVDVHQALRLSAYLGIAWLAGVAVAIMPAGLGIREAVFVGIGYISDDSSFQLYASIAIVARAIQVLQDLLSAFLVPAIVGLGQKKHEAGAQETQDS